MKEEMKTLLSLFEKQGWNCETAGEETVVKKELTGSKGREATTVKIVQRLRDVTVFVFSKIDNIEHLTVKMTLPMEKITDVFGLAEEVFETQAESIIQPWR